LGGGWQAHSVRRESCDAHSSTEPAAREYGEGVVGDKGGRALVRGLVRRGGLGYSHLMSLTLTGRPPAAADWSEAKMTWWERRASLRLVRGMSSFLARAVKKESN